MREVRSAEPLRTCERVADAEPFDLGDRYDEADEREPGKARQHEQHSEKGEREVREHPGPEGSRRGAVAHGRTRHDPDGADIGERERRCPDDGEQIPVPPVQLGREHTGEPRQDPDRDGPERVPLVEPNRLGHELPYGSGLGRQGCRKRPPRRGFARAALRHRAEP